MSEYVAHDPQAVQQHGHITIGARHLLATGKHGPGSPLHHALRYLARVPGATRAHDKTHNKAYAVAHSAGQKFTHHSTPEHDHTPGAHHHQLAAQYGNEIAKDNPPRRSAFDGPVGPPPRPHYGPGPKRESLFDRACGSAVIDEGFTDKVKGWFGGSSEPAHPMKGMTAKRKKSRRSDSPGPSGPTPNHPAFQALAARTHAQPSRHPSPHVDPKATTAPIHHPSEPGGRVTKVSPAHAHLAATTTREHPAVGSSGHMPEPAPGNELATRHQPGTLQHTVHLFRQAKAIRSQVSRPVHVVQHGAKRYITTAPKHGAKILHTYESLGDAILRFRSMREQTSALSVGPFMGSINGEPAVDVRSEGGKKPRRGARVIPLVRRSGPAAP